jgi:pyruvate-formate lyase-activating enzyme
MPKLRVGMPPTSYKNPLFIISTVNRQPLNYLSFLIINAKLYYVMSRTVLLINPPIYDFAAYDFFNKPLGLLYLASFLRQAGYEIRYLDCLDRNHPALTDVPNLPVTRPNGTGKYYHETLETPACLKHIPRIYRRYGLPENILSDLLEVVKNHHPPQAVLVTSMMTYWYPAVVDTIKLVRKIIPNVPVALGGVYATLIPDHAQKTCQPDKLFTGPSMRNVLRWLDGLTHTQRDYSPIQEDFPHWPLLAYDLYPKLNYLTLITSLGCPFHCDYCASRNLQPHLQQLPPVTFLEQLHQLLPMLNLTQSRINLAFMDDALLASAENHIIPILQQTEKIDLPLYFHCPNGLHCRFVTPEVAELMVTNRFRMIRLSFESADTAARWQKASDNKTSESDLMQAVENLETAGYRRADLEGYILTGLPGQTYNEIRQSADFVHDLGIQVRLCQYSPIPGTKLFANSCREYGVDPTEPLLHNNSILPALDKRITLNDFQKFKDHIQSLNRSLV